MKNFQRIAVILIPFVLLTESSEASVSDRSGRVRRFTKEGCDELIPAFLDQIRKHGDAGGDCDDSGQFPIPGDCTVFFKCVNRKGKPLKEYCAIGYIFINGTCIQDQNATGCPQHDCVYLKNSIEDADYEPTSKPPTIAPTGSEFTGGNPNTDTGNSVLEDQQYKEASPAPTAFAAQQTSDELSSGNNGIRAFYIMIIFQAFSLIIIQ